MNEAETRHLESIYHGKPDVVNKLNTSLLHQVFSGELTALHSLLQLDLAATTKNVKEAKWQI